MFLPFIGLAMLGWILGRKLLGIKSAKAE
jgi:hypothetical protein